MHFERVECHAPYNRPREGDIVFMRVEFRYTNGNECDVKPEQGREPLTFPPLLDPSDPGFRVRRQQEPVQTSFKICALFTSNASSVHPTESALSTSLSDPYLICYGHKLWVADADIVDW